MMSELTAKQNHEAERISKFELEEEGSEVRIWPVFLTMLVVHEGCEFIWKGQGQTKELIRSALKVKKKEKNYGDASRG
jgi:hypothetical protein